VQCAYARRTRLQGNHPVLHRNNAKSALALPNGAHDRGDWRWRHRLSRAYARHPGSLSRYGSRTAPATQQHRVMRLRARAGPCDKSARDWSEAGIVDSQPSTCSALRTIACSSISIVDCLFVQQSGVCGTDCLQGVDAQLSVYAQVATKARPRLRVVARTPASTRGSEQNLTNERRATPYGRGGRSCP
jgi:hypothetical protein